LTRPSGTGEGITTASVVSCRLPRVLPTWGRCGSATRNCRVIWPRPTCMRFRFFSTSLYDQKHARDDPQGKRDAESWADSVRSALQELGVAEHDLVLLHTAEASAYRGIEVLVAGDEPLHAFISPRRTIWPSCRASFPDATCWPFSPESVACCRNIRGCIFGPRHRRSPNISLD
jgi:hypothetical protein